MLLHSLLFLILGSVPIRYLPSLTAPLPHTIDAEYRVSREAKMIVVLAYSEIAGRSQFELLLYQLQCRTTIKRPCR